MVKSQKKILHHDADSYAVFKANNSSPICQLFYGKIENLYKCSFCKELTKVREPFLFIRLNLPEFQGRGVENIRLENLMEEEFEKKSIFKSEERWECGNCQKDLLATTWKKISKCPKNFVHSIQKVFQF